MRDFAAVEPGALDQKRRLLKVSTTRTVSASVEEVWTVIADPGTWVDWHDDYDVHRAEGDDEHGLGTQLYTRESLFRYESVVVRWEPNHVLGIMIVRGNWLRWLIRQYYTQLELESVANESGTSRCRIRYRVVMGGTPLFWLLSAYTVGQTLASVYFSARKSLRRLDQLLPGDTP